MCMIISANASTLYNIIVELLYNDKFISNLISTNEILLYDLFISYVNIGRYKKCVKHILFAEISKNNMLLFRENTVGIRCLVTFLNFNYNIANKFSKTNRLPKLDMLTMLISDFFSQLGRNSNVIYILHRIKNVCASLSKNDIVVCAIFLISKVFIPCLLGIPNKKDKIGLEIAKIAQIILNMIVNVKTNTVNILVDHYCIYSKKFVSNGYQDHIIYEPDIVRDDVNCDYYYSHYDIFVQIRNKIVGWITQLLCSTNNLPILLKNNIDIPKICIMLIYLRNTGMYLYNDNQLIVSNLYKILKS